MKHNTHSRRAEECWIVAFIVWCLIMQAQAQTQKKTSISAIAGIVLGVGILIIGLNYWHAMKCVKSKGIDDMDDYINALEKRILELESQVLFMNIL